MRDLEQLADGVFVLAGFPRYAVNVYLLDDVLVDAATRWHAGPIIRQLRGRKLMAHALTHVHPDHQGASHAICESLRLPLWCSDVDAPAMEIRGEMESHATRHWLNRWIGPILAGPPHPVSRRLNEGDRVGSFVVIETPGHTAGHLSLWRESDRILVVGDVLANMHIMSGRTGLREPPLFFSLNPAENRRSARRLSELNAALVCFGHGPPLRDGHLLRDFVSNLGSFEDSDGKGDSHAP